MERECDHLKDDLLDAVEEDHEEEKFDDLSNLRRREKNRRRSERTSRANGKVLKLTRGVYRARLGM